MADDLPDAREDQFGDLLATSGIKAFEWLVESAGPKVLTLIRRQFRHLDAEDVLQEALGRAIQYRSTYRRPSSSAAWFLQIARNVGLSRSAELVEAAELLRCLRTEASTEHRAKTQTTQPIDERLDVLEQAICQLSSEKQRVVRTWLKHQAIGEPEISEIAKELGKNASNVSAQWHYARRDLKKLMLKLLEERGLSV